MAARRWVIRGLVQGVGFRHATSREALRLGLRGWVRNRFDGAVEAVAIGNEAQLAALDRWLWHGPAAARVVDVDATVVPDDALAQLEPPIGDGFSQVRTVA